LLGFFCRIIRPPVMKLVAVVCSVALAGNVTSEVTFYGAKDNCPPGGDIAYPSSDPGRHQAAGGSGTWEDPVTFAGAEKAVGPGTRVYVPFLKKYAVMEDQCEECEDDWKSGKWHMDIWMGPDQATQGPGLIACEDALSRSSAQVWVDPPQGLEVDSTPLFDGSCIVEAPPCTDVGTDCGNSCEIPEAESCSALADLFGLTTTRFHALNSDLDCSGTVPSGTSVCMGGTCGDMLMV